MKGAAKIEKKQQQQQQHQILAAVLEALIAVYEGALATIYCHQSLPMNNVVLTAQNVNLNPLQLKFLDGVF